MAVQNELGTILNNLFPSPLHGESFASFINQDGRDVADITIPADFDVHFASFPLRYLEPGDSVNIDVTGDPMLRSFQLATIYRAIGNEDEALRSMHPYSKHFDSEAVLTQLYSNIASGGTFQLQREEVIYDIENGKTFFVRTEEDKERANQLLLNNENAIRCNRFILSKEMMATVPTSILHQLGTEIASLGNSPKDVKKFAAKILNDLGLEAFLASLALAKMDVNQIASICKSIREQTGNEWFSNIGIADSSELKNKIPKPGSSLAWTAISNLCTQLNSNEPAYTSHSMEDFEHIRRSIKTMEEAFQWRAVDTENIEKYRYTVNLPRHVRIMVYLRGYDEAFAKLARNSGLSSTDIAKMFDNNMHTTMTSELATAFSQDTAPGKSDHRFYYPQDKDLSKIDLNKLIDAQILSTIESRAQS